MSIVSSSCWCYCYMMYQYLHLYFVTFHLPSGMTWTLILRKKNLLVKQTILLRSAPYRKQTKMKTPELLLLKVYQLTLWCGLFSVRNFNHIFDHQMFCIVIWFCDHFKQIKLTLDETWYEFFTTLTWSPFSISYKNFEQNVKWLLMVIHYNKKSCIFL